MTESIAGPLTLHFQDVTRVAGETLQGRVDLNIQLAKEDRLEHVWITFRGKIHTSITTSKWYQRGDTEYFQTVTMFNTKCPLWDQGTTDPAPGSRLVSCPFEFKLPDALPPTFHCTAYLDHRFAIVVYSIEVIGQRTGFFRGNRRIRRFLSVVPAATERQLLVKELLQLQSWRGDWKTHNQEKELRKGMMGEYAHARLTMPDLPSFPIGTPIPFSIHVETDTKPMTDEGSNTPEYIDKRVKSMFPAPPDSLREMNFQLRRLGELRVGKRARQAKDDYELYNSGGMAVHKETNAPEWIPDPGHDIGKGRGIWRRSVKFDSTVSIPYTPTFRTAAVECQYQLKFIVPFEGIGNDLKVLVPIHLDPASACPRPPTEGIGHRTIMDADANEKKRLGYKLLSSAHVYVYVVVYITGSVTTLELRFWLISSKTTIGHLSDYPHL
ncbi:hypothetical protein GGX14DRAFT_654253 [Mycena pura]|uniref:Arrestin-like N-terminal domain-containing protein n=1 Tax=Mycena pura TaxID=153505 RepID=A0AAD6VBD1_9AGAR|nr:hypothetical protein GGX14DRAFT_654253 [Mycena pura]